MVGECDGTSWLREMLFTPTALVRDSQATQCPDPGNHFQRAKGHQRGPPGRVWGCGSCRRRGCNATGHLSQLHPAGGLWPEQETGSARVPAYHARPVDGFPDPRGQGPADGAQGWYLCSCPARDLSSSWHEAPATQEQKIAYSSFVDVESTPAPARYPDEVPAGLDAVPMMCVEGHDLPSADILAKQMRFMSALEGLGAPDDAVTNIVLDALHVCWLPVWCVCLFSCPGNIPVHAHRSDSSTCYTRRWRPSVRWRLCWIRPFLLPHRSPPRIQK
jgi:hypothetical protein